MKNVQLSTGENDSKLVFDTDSKMLKIAQDLFEQVSNSIPFLRVNSEDGICSSVMFWGSFDEPLSWQNGIFENSRYFRISIFPSPKQRYYSGGNVSIEMFTYHGCKRMRTGNHLTPEKAIEKINFWLYNQIEEFKEKE